jgi:hypothetical protein
MSAARIQKLKSLLSRVQERRAEPRTAVRRGAIAAVLDPALQGSAPQAQQELRVVPPPAPAQPRVERSELPEALAPSSAPPGNRGSEQSRSAPTVEDLPALPPLDALPATPQPLTQSLEPAPIPAAPAARKPEPLPVVQPAPEPEPVVSAASARVEPSAPRAAEPVARAVSAPRVEAPRSFGDLLELSLSLRPR